MKVSFILAVASLVTGVSASVDPITDILQTLEKLTPFSDEWNQGLENILKNSWSQNEATRESGKSIEFWAPYFPDLSEVSVETDETQYDYIIVGGGTSGCAVAGVLSAISQKNILILERGVAKSMESTPEAMNIYGAGLAYTNPEIAQTFITMEGIRTFDAAISGGSSSINLGQFAFENADYFHQLSSASGVPIDMDKILKAEQFIKAKVGFPVPSTSYFTGFSNGLLKQGVSLFSATEPPPSSSGEVIEEKQWTGYSSFQPGSSQPPRISAEDAFLLDSKGSYPPNVTFMNQQTVEKVEFNSSINPPSANCLIYHPTTKFDVNTNGKTLNPLTIEGDITKPIIDAILDPVQAFVDVEAAILGLAVLKYKRRRVCVKPGGKIIISAGPIQSPLLLFKSGIGPEWQINLLNRPLVSKNESIGQEVIDRVMIPVNGYLSEEPSVVYQGAGATRSVKNTPARNLQPTEIGSRFFPGVFPGQDILFGTSPKLFSAITGGVIPGLDQMPFFGTSLANPLNIANIAMQNPFVHIPGTIFGKSLASTDTIGSITNIWEKSLGPFNPGTIFADSEFGFLPKGFNPYFGTTTAGSRTPVGMVSDLTFKFNFKQIGMSPPGINGINALKNIGPNCSEQVNSLDCTASTASAYYGARVSEGILISARNKFPPFMRDDPIVDSMMRTLKDCSNDIPPYNNPFLLPLCAIYEPVLSCLRREVTNYYYTAQPQSRGKIKLFPTGLVEIEGNYLQSEKDFFDAIRGVSQLIDVMNSDALRGVLQEKYNPIACPATILNAFVELVAIIQAIENPLIRPQNVSDIISHFDSLLPTEYRTLRKGSREVIGEKVLETKVNKKEPARRTKRETKQRKTEVENKTFLKVTRRLNSFDLEDLPDSTAELRESIQECFIKKEISSTLFEGTCKKTDVCCSAYGNTKCISLTETQKNFIKKWLQKLQSLREESLIDDNVDIEKIGERGQWFLTQMTHSSQFFDGKFGLSSQWAASYPPLLPPTTMPEFVGKYAKTYMTSANSFVNTVPLGKAIDSNFEVIGTKGLLVIDQSILNVLPRIDPMATTMVMAVYGATNIAS